MKSLNGTMKSIIKYGLSLLVFTSLVVPSGSCRGAVLSAEKRAVINFNPDWKFIRENVDGAEKPKFKDKQWQDVGLPHTYNDQDTFDKFYGHESYVKARKEKHLRSEGDGGWNGKTWYRKHFTMDKKFQNRSVYLEIEAARTVARVWLNGRFLGEYASGFSTFAFDITPDLLFNGENVLAIQVDDTEGQDICPGNDSHWQPVLGGLYRNVRLHVTDPLHVTLPYYSFLKTEGVYFGVTALSPLEADVRFTTEVVNGYKKGVRCELNNDFVDADGKTVLTLTSTQVLKAGERFKFDQAGKIRRPNKWDIDDPYLYHVVTSVKMDGREVDSITTPVGIRTLGFDHKKRTFLLNGKRLVLTGWGQKPNYSWPGLGSALPDWLVKMNMQLMKAGNGNIVRWGHCAGPVAALEEGDRIGYMNWQPNISGEGQDKGEMWKMKVDVTRDIIIRDRNHPSLVFWEGNNHSMGGEHAKEIRDIVEKWDWISTRPFSIRGGYKDPDEIALLDFSMGMNGSDFVRSLCGVESELDRMEVPRRCWDGDSYPHLPASVTNHDYFKTQQDACRKLVTKFLKIAKRGGGVKWHFTCDTTHLRLLDYAVARLTGTLDATRLPKDMYGALRVAFSEAENPDIHLMGHWNYEEKKVHTVDVYSTCEEVELLVNGKSLGKKPVEVSDRRVTWEDVAFEPGKIEAIGYNGGSPDVYDERVTAGAPAAIKLDYFTNPDGMRADRSDVAIITATIVDKDGNWHPLADPKITFAVAGPGNYRGGFNSYIEGTTGKESLLAEAGKIRVSVRATDKPGKVTVRAISKGLEQAIVSFDVLPVKP